MKKSIVTTTVAAGVFLAGTVTADAALGDQPLSLGMKHQDVKALQDALKQTGHFTYHTSTGYYGDITKQAVQNYQKANKLTETGIADTPTLEKIIKKPASSTEAQTTALKIGVRGQAVTNLQDQLRQEGVFHQSTTGYFGTITEAAVKQFQLRNGLNVTGTADASTLEALNKKIESPQQSTSRSQSPVTTTLSVGSRGQAVTDLQKLLVDANLFNYHTYTGYYGEVTAKGVREFQQKLNLPITGKADQPTIAALKEYVKNQQQTSQVLPISTDQPSLTPGQTNVKNSATPSQATPNQAPTNQSTQFQNTVPSQQQPSSQVSPTISNTQQETLDPSIPRNLPEFTFVLKVGSSGEAVRELQHQLKALELLTVNATGYFGPSTEEAVKAFQKQHNLIADGLVTTKTMQKLVEETTKKLLPVVTLPSETSSTFSTINLIADSSELIGIPYKWGGTTSEGFDCSGFIQYVFQKNSIQLPRTVSKMWEVGTEISELQVGDLVFFETYMPGPSHAGIYIGNNQFIHSSSSQGVSISNLESSYYSTRYLGAKRYN